MMSEASIPGSAAGSPLGVAPGADPARTSYGRRGTRPRLGDLLSAAAAAFLRRHFGRNWTRRPVRLCAPATAPSGAAAAAVAAAAAAAAAAPRRSLCDLQPAVAAVAPLRWVRRHWAAAARRRSTLSGRSGRSRHRRSGAGSALQRSCASTRTSGGAAGAGGGAAAPSLPRPGRKRRCSQRQEHRLGLWLMQQPTPASHRLQCRRGRRGRSSSLVRRLLLTSSPAWERGRTRLVS